ncbi:hypothetical protein JYT93_00290 [bacterium AH-315-J19]|nr:hypothetical protein [Robiginitomaculum sp.]MBN4058453.1 hypothetical protein [bacterium AH-315-J19]
MKKSIALLLFGLVLGIGGMWWVQRPDAPPPASQVGFIEFTIKIPEDVLSLTHGFAGGIGRTPDTIASLENSEISHMLGFTARIRDTDGTLVGLASELEIFPDDKGIRPGISWKTDWTVNTPQGTLFMYEEEGVPAAHLPAFASVVAGKNWTGSLPAQVSVGPHPSGRGIIIGGTGIYEGATGTFVEKVELRSLTTEGELRGVMYLQIYLDKKEGEK